jgi:hypothetical protein
MIKKSKVELSADSVRQAIADVRPASMTQLAHQKGYKGRVCSTLTKKFRVLLPEIDGLLATNKPSQGGKVEANAGTAPKIKTAKPKSVDKPKPSAKPAGGKWAHHPQNPFREGSAYGTCFDILAANPEGMTREKLVETLAKTTGKPPKLSAFISQVVLSAKGAASEGLNPFEGPRNRSCRFGFWVKRENSHVQLVLPAASTVSKETP